MSASCVSSLIPSSWRHCLWFVSVRQLLVEHAHARVDLRSSRRRLLCYQRVGSWSRSALWAVWAHGSRTNDGSHRAHEQTRWSQRSHSHSRYRINGAATRRRRNVTSPVHIVEFTHVFLPSSKLYTRMDYSIADVAQAAGASVYHFSSQVPYSRMLRSPCRTTKNP